MERDEGRCASGDRTCDLVKVVGDLKDELGNVIERERAGDLATRPDRVLTGKSRFQGKDGILSRACIYGR